MTKFPPVTIIIPSFNRGNYITMTIDSILIQNYPNLNIMIVDAKSTDNTIEKIRPYLQRINLCHTENQPYFSTVNYGVDRCNTDIFCILMAGDLVNTGMIEAAVDAFLSNPELTVAYPNIINITENGRVINQEIPEDYDFLKMLEEHYSLEIYGGFFRRSKLAGMPFYGLNYGSSAHYEMCLRLGLSGPMQRLKSAFVIRRKLRKIFPITASEKLTAASKVKVIKDLYTRSDLPQEILDKRSMAMSSAYYNAAIMPGKSKNKYMAASFYHKIKWPEHISKENKRKTSEVLLAVGNPLTSWLYNRAKDIFKSKNKNT